MVSLSYINYDQNLEKLLHTIAAFIIQNMLYTKKKRTNSVSSTASRYVSEALFTNFYQNRNLIKTNEKQLVDTISP